MGIFLSVPGRGDSGEESQQGWGCYCLFKVGVTVVRNQDGCVIVCLR